MSPDTATSSDWSEDGGSDASSPADPKPAPAVYSSIGDKGGGGGSKVSAQKGQLFATPEMQSSVHKMLSHLQEWWEHSEELLEMMANKKLPCKSLVSMSEEIDNMLDKSISKLIEDVSIDPGAFPVAALISTARDIKKYLFLKVGEICCQAGKEDECAKMANKALVSLKKFRNSAGDLYDTILTQAMQEMDSDEEETPGVSSEELNKLINSFKRVRIADDNSKARSKLLCP